MIVTTLLSSIWTANGFENVWLLTQGGPSDATMVFPVLAYFGMQTQRLGEAAAVSVAMLPVLAILVIFATTLMQRGTRTDAPRLAVTVTTGAARMRAGSPPTPSSASLAVADACCLPDLLDDHHLAEAAARDLPRCRRSGRRSLTWTTTAMLIDDKGFLTNIRNSLIVAGCVTVISLLISSFAAYSHGPLPVPLPRPDRPADPLRLPDARPRCCSSRSRSSIAQLSLGNSLHGLILVYLTFSLPLSTWLLQGYFRGVPRELEEQAMVDGSTRLGALFRIVLPLSAPGLAAVAHLHLHRRLERAAAGADLHHLGTTAHRAARRSTT